MRRKRSRRKRKERITEIIEANKGPKEIYKNNKKMKISKMMKNNEEETTDREEILSLCANFYKALYQKTIENPINFNLDQNKEEPEEEPLPFTEEEVEKILKKMR